MYSLRFGVKDVQFRIEGLEWRVSDFMFRTLEGKAYDS